MVQREIQSAPTDALNASIVDNDSGESVKDGGEAGKLLENMDAPLSATTTTNSLPTPSPTPCVSPTLTPVSNGGLEHPFVNSNFMGAETFYGTVETVEDAILVVEACRRGLLPRVARRLGDRDRALIRPGSIFVFVERESGIKRWTDGKIWSPSRITGDFLSYRQLEQRLASTKRGGETVAGPLRTLSMREAGGSFAHYAPNYTSPARRIEVGLERQGTVLKKGWIGQKDDLIENWRGNVSSYSLLFGRSNLYTTSKIDTQQIGHVRNLTGTGSIYSYCTASQPGEWHFICPTYCFSSVAISRAYPS